MPLEQMLLVKQEVTSTILYVQLKLQSNW